jgi:hypothetical protein
VSFWGFLLDVFDRSSDRLGQSWTLVSVIEGFRDIKHERSSKALLSIVPILNSIVLESFPAGIVLSLTYILQKLYFHRENLIPTKFPDRKLWLLQTD